MFDEQLFPIRMFDVGLQDFIELPGYELSKEWVRLTDKVSQMSGENNNVFGEVTTMNGEKFHVVICGEVYCKLVPYGEPIYAATLIEVRLSSVRFF